MNQSFSATTLNRIAWCQCRRDWRNDDLCASVWFIMLV